MRRILLGLILSYHSLSAFSDPQTMPPPAPPPTHGEPCPDYPSLGPAPGEFSYGTFSPGREVLRSWSLFTTLEENGCSLPVVLLSNVAVSRVEALFVRSAVEKAVDQWTSALLNSPNFPCAGRSRIAWQATPTAGPAISIYIDGSVSRSYALVGQYEIRLSPEYKDPRNANAEKVILHEMGHMVGLSDTYTEPGYQQPIGQPSGIMNNLYEVSGLTLDDLKGAYALHEFINGRGQFCEDGYGIGGAFENRNNVAFCVPF